MTSLKFPSIASVLKDDRDYRNSRMFCGSSISLLAFSAAVLSAQQTYGQSLNSIGYWLNIILWILKDIEANFPVVKFNPYFPHNPKECKKLLADFLPPVHKHSSCDCGRTMNLCNDCGLGSTTCVYCKSDHLDKFEFFSIPIIPVLKMMHECPYISQNLISKPTSENSSSMRDIKDSPAWMQAWQQTLKNPGDVGLLFESDGVNTNRFLGSGPYSVTLNAVAIANLPPKLRTNPALIIPNSIVFGPKMASSMNAVELFVAEEMRILQSSGVSGVVVAANATTVNLRAASIAFIGDTVGLNKRSNRAGATAAFADPYSSETQGVYLKQMHAMSFPHSRKFLNPDHNFRHSSKGFISNSPEQSPRPQLRSDLTTAGADEFRRICESAEQAICPEDRKELLSLKTMHLKQYGRKEWSPLQSAGIDATSKTVADDMHTLTNVYKRLWSLITGHSDSEKLRLQEKLFDRFQSVWPLEATKKLPPSLWSLTPIQKLQLEPRLSQIRFPKHMDTVDRSCITNCDNMCSSDYHNVNACLQCLPYQATKLGTSGVLEYLIRGMLKPDQEFSLFHLLSSLRQLSARIVTPDEVAILKERLPESIALMELHWPACIQTLMMHILNYFPYLIEQFGPMQTTSMFAFERWNKWMLDLINMKQHRESNLLEVWRTSFVCFLLRCYGVIPSGIMTDIVDGSGHEEQILITTKITAGSLFNPSEILKLSQLAGESLQMDSFSAVSEANITPINYASPLTYAVATKAKFRDSSIVFRANANSLHGIQFGKITSLFTAAGSKSSPRRQYAFAKVSYFRQFELKGNIYVVNLTDHETVYQTLTSLSPPLVSALDESKPEVLS